MRAGYGLSLTPAALVLEGADQDTVRAIQAFADEMGRTRKTLGTSGSGSGSGSESGNGSRHHYRLMQSIDRNGASLRGDFVAVFGVVRNFGQYVGIVVCKAGSSTNERVQWAGPCRKSLTLVPLHEKTSLVFLCPLATRPRFHSRLPASLPTDGDGVAGLYCT
jgi:hypothetical protein